MGSEKVCKNCGKKFYAEDRKKIFCCYKCRHSYELMMKRLNQSEDSSSLAPSQDKASTKKLVSIAEAGRSRIPKESLNSLLKTNTYKAPVSIDFKEYTTFYKMADEYHRSYNFVRAICREQGLKPVVRSTILLMANQ